MKQLTLFLILVSTLNLTAQQKTKLIIQQEGFSKKHGLRVLFNNQSIKINKEGKLLYEGEVDITEPTYGIVIQKSGMYSGFWLEPGVGEVLIKKKGFPASLEVKDSESHKVYQSVKHAKDAETFKSNFLQFKDHKIAVGVLNEIFKFQKLSNEDLKMLYEATSVKNKELLSSVKAYLNTIGVEKIKKGSEILDFEAKDQNGNTFNTKSYRGKYLLIDFAATGCGPCWLGYPDMIEESEKYENLQVITYNQDHDIDTWNKIAKNRDIKIDWPVLWEATNKLDVFEIYNVEGWPLHFLISPEGKVLETWYGSGSGTLANTLKKYIK